MPSGHAQESVVLWGSIAHFTGTKWFWALTVILLLLIGFSRVYLGVHFPTDVIAGWTVGIALLWLYILFHPAIENWIGGRHSSIQLLLVLAVPLGLLVMHSGVVVAFQSGMLLGIGAGAIVRTRFISFSSRCTTGAAVARYAVGIIVLVGSLSLLRGMLSLSGNCRLPGQGIFSLGMQWNMDQPGGPRSFSPAENIAVLCLTPGVLSSIVSYRQNNGGPCSVMAAYGNRMRRSASLQRS